MIDRYLPLCAAALVACGPDVRAGEAPSLADLTESTRSAYSAGSGAAAQTVPGQDAIAGAALAAAAASAAPGTRPVELTVPALLYSDLDADVAARTTGVITRVSVELGDGVRAGQVLARLDDAREMARLAAATAAVERARADHARVDGLHASGYVTESDLDEARFQLHTAEAALRVAQVELEYMRVVAPFGGVVTRRHTGLGRVVREGEPLFRITALQPLRASARLAEHDARGLRRGAAALLFDGHGAQVEAHVVRVAPAVEPGSGTVEVILSVPKPGPFLPGSSATLRLGRTDSGPRN